MIADIFAPDVDIFLLRQMGVDIFAVDPERYSAAVTGGHRWRMEHETAQRKAALSGETPAAPELPPAIEAATAKTEALKPAAAMPEPPKQPTAATIEAAPRKPKPQKQPKPAPEPQPTLSKQNQLGFHESAIKRALETFQPGSGKGTREQLISHLGKHQGASQEAELTGLHDFLKDKPTVTREDILGYLNQSPHQVKMEEYGLEDGPKKWQVTNDHGEQYGSTYDTEEEAMQAADEMNHQDQQELRNIFSVEGGEPHYTVDANQLEILEEREKELGGDMDMAASRALQRLERTKFGSSGEATQAVYEYLKDHMPNVAEEYGDNPVEEHPGEFTVRSPLSQHRHNRHFGNTYDSEEEAQQAIDDYVSENFESPYSHQEVERGDEPSEYEQYSLEGPKSNYNETHVAIPGLVNKKPPDTTGFTAELLVEQAGQNKDHQQFAIRDSDGKRMGLMWTLTKDPQEAIKLWADEHGNRSISWKDGHGNYQYIDNPVVRIRHDDRETTDGKKMFMVEELQGPSDTNQEKMPKWLQGRIYEIGLKRALMKAVQGGYERMGWSRGEQIADHYSLLKRVDRIEWHPDPNGMTGELIGVKNGNPIITQSLHPADLPEYVGGDLAAKLLASKVEKPEGYKGKDFHFVEGPDLEVGGIGLKQLYDRDLHKRLLDIKIGDKKLKNLGVKIGTSEIDAGDSGEFDPKTKENITHHTVHSIDITPELAAEIKKHGVSLYRRSESPERYDRAMLDVVRRMPSHEAAIYALGLLRLMDFRPDLMRTFSTEDISYLRSIVQQIRYNKDEAVSKGPAVDCDIFRVK